MLLAAGDIAGCDWSGDESTAAILDGHPDATVQTLGDNAYPKGMQAEFQDCYGPSWGRHKSRTRAAVGNHEYEWFYSDAWGHYEYFGAAAAGEYGEYFYSYDLGPWHVVVLNSNCAAVSCAPGSAQEQWLRTDLASSEAAPALTQQPQSFLRGDRAFADDDGLGPGQVDHGGRLAREGTSVDDGSAPRAELFRDLLHRAGIRPAGQVRARGRNRPDLPQDLRNVTREVGEPYADRLGAAGEPREAPGRVRKDQREGAAQERPTLELGDRRMERRFVPRDDRSWLRLSPPLEPIERVNGLLPKIRAQAVDGVRRQDDRSAGPDPGHCVRDHGRSPSTTRSRPARSWVVVTST